MALIPGGYFAVDAFFFLSGLLTFALLTEKVFAKRGRFPWHMVYIHRFLRLFIPIAFLTGFFMLVYPYVEDSLTWGNFTDTYVKQFCGNWKWLPNLFFINNMVPWTSD